MKVMNRRLLAALIFPVVCLALLCVYKAVRREIGSIIEIPITGYDPRDLLSGHYLTYRLDLEPAVCRNVSGTAAMYVCVSRNPDGTLHSRTASGSGDREGCDALILGECRGGQFLAGVERFYIPEEHSKQLDRMVRDRRASLSLSVDRNGRAVVRDLLLDGKSWKKQVKEQGR